MDCIYLGWLKTTKEYFYKATENCYVNLLVTNTHTASLTVTINMNVNGGESISIFNDTMLAGEQLEIKDIAMKSAMAIGGLAQTASLVSVKFDKQ